jgi:predicted transcriptional regulator
MKKASPTTYRIGSIREFAEWTQRVVRDSKAGHGVPKTWFDSEDTAKRAGAEQVSAEAMVKLLSSGNLAVLAAIRQHKPGSMRELAELTGRKEASLSRTLKRFAQVGIVGFQDGPHRTRMPSLIARRVHLEIDLTGHHSAVAVDGSR